MRQRVNKAERCMRESSWHGAVGMEILPRSHLGLLLGYVEKMGSRKYNGNAAIKVNLIYDHFRQLIETRAKC